MKVLEQGKKKEESFKNKCKGCNSKLEYTMNDVRHDRDGNFIVCPVCQAWISVQ